MEWCVTTGKEEIGLPALSCHQGRKQSPMFKTDLLYIKVWNPELWLHINMSNS